MTVTLFQSRKSLVLASALSFSVFFVSVSAFAASWSFGIISDTQWKDSADGKNPNYVAVNVINHINQEFIEHGVKFVVAVGDVTQNGDKLGMDTTATFRQALYNAGIGFYPLRGNHEDAASEAAEFIRVFPQTQNGINNMTPLDAMVTTPYYGAPPLNTNTPFTVGSNFTTVSADFAGLTYSFDYNNARFVLIDQFETPTTPTHSVLNQADVDWVGTRLSSRPENTHAFVFAHKHLSSENHADTLFGANPSVNPDGLQDLYMSHLYENGVRYHIGGHDHMHNRALVTSPDGKSVVQNIITASDSYKFYIPQNPANDDKYNTPEFGINNGPREEEIAQQLFTIGYYIVTVDGPRVTVDYYASPNGCNGDCDQNTDIIPYTFTKQESFGYSLNGQEFLVPQNESYTIVDDRFNRTKAQILDGINSSTGTDFAGRPFTKDINTGWTSKKYGKQNFNNEIVSDILTLWGMSEIGVDQTDTYTLAMSYEDARPSAQNHGKGWVGLATRDDDGNWINAVDLNFGGTKKFVYGPWQPGYELGTYGIDTRTRTVWAVVNYGDGDFAAASLYEHQGPAKRCSRNHHFYAHNSRR